MSYSPESVRNVGINDQTAGVDSLGFKPYVTAIAKFLLNPETKPPLTLSIEGEWGSGKSSFMKQLEKYLREEGKQRTVWFNAWRHDKAEAVWAAFALSFIKQISTPQSWRDWYRIPWGYFKLQWLRFNKEKGLFEVIKALPLILFVTCTAIAIPLILANDGVEGINELVKVATSEDDLWKQIGAAFNLLFAVGGLTLSGTGAIAAIRSLFGNFQKLLVSPKNNLIKYLEAPDYKKQSAFIEEFHEDFSKIVDAYIGDGKVFVFIDDLDRCEHPKSADLMQAINLMIADDPSVVFILGMDREKVAASLAVKYESILAYLPSENPEIDPEILARRSASKGLAYGYTFIEKFVQLPFQVPQPSQADFERFFDQLSNITAKNQEEIPIAKNQEARKKNELSEKIKLTFERDSSTVRDIIIMVAPALDYNPRRIKQFINVFRLKAYIAYETGLFYEEKTNDHKTIYQHLTLQQLGKFTAISLRWPLLLLDLETDRQLLHKLQDFILQSYPIAEQLEELQKDKNVRLEELQKDKNVCFLHKLQDFILQSYPTSEQLEELQKDKNVRLEELQKDKNVRYWSSHSKLKELIVYGRLEKSEGDQTPQINPTFSLAAMKVERLLQVSPPVVRATVKTNTVTQKKSEKSKNHHK